MNVAGKRKAFQTGRMCAGLTGAWTDHCWVVLIGRGDLSSSDYSYLALSPACFQPPIALPYKERDLLWISLGVWGALSFQIPLSLNSLCHFENLYNLMHFDTPGNPPTQSIHRRFPASPKGFLRHVCSPSFPLPLAPWNHWSPFCHYRKVCVLQNSAWIEFYSMYSFVSGFFHPA